MKKTGPCALLLLCGCFAQQPGGAPLAASAPSYQAAGEGWTLTIEAGRMHLRETAGPLRFDYFGELPPRQPIAGGLRFEGEVMRDYVIAGLAEEEMRRYSLTIREQSCIDARGRSWPTSVTWHFSDEHRPIGCGSRLPD